MITTNIETYRKLIEVLAPGDTVRQIETLREMAEMIAKLANEIDPDGSAQIVSILGKLTDGDVEAVTHALGGQHVIPAVQAQINATMREIKVFQSSLRQTQATLNQAVDRRYAKPSSKHIPQLMAGYDEVRQACAQRWEEFLDSDPKYRKFCKLHGILDYEHYL